MRATILVLLGLASSASADCPSRAEVEEQLRVTVPELGPRAFELTDDGAAWAVTVDGFTRRFDDPALVCSDRASKAAVVIALAAQHQAEAPVVPRVVSTRRDPPARPSSVTDDVRWPSVELEARGLFTIAPAQGATPTGGGGLRVFVGTRHIGAIVGVAGLAPAGLVLDGVDASLWRVPFELGARGRLFVRRLALSLDGAVVLGPSVTKGVSVANSERQTRFEIGLSAAVRAEYWVTRRVAPLLEVGVEGTLKDYDLSVPGLGLVGHPPRTWLSVAAGLAVRLR